MRATGRQDFSDALSGGDPKDAGPDVRIRCQYVHEWQDNDHHSHSEDEQLIDSGI